MKPCEFLPAISINAGVASNLTRDLISKCLLEGEIFKGDDKIETLREIKRRLSQAITAASDLEKLALASQYTRQAPQEQLFTLTI
jgi:hypothetical protein